MTRDEIISTIKNSADAIKAEGATAIYLFGSRLRGDNDQDSDVDLFIDYRKDQSFSLMELVGIQHIIEDALDLDVDVTTRNSLHPLLKKNIEAEAMRIF